ncbi:2TM domain-containing protein [Leeuwenhoekiella sp. NPDC079379]|uniref:2TM domain-containing protein n=1 Tax=Leeuwenhoekiella sp. NPDC079379 TaxID=3364122 RepID=UPI0037C9891F
MNNFIKEFGKACIVGFAIYIVFLIIHLGGGNALAFNSSLAEDFAQSMVYSVVLYLFNMSVFKYYYGKNLNNLYAFKHLIKAITASLFVTISGIFLIRMFLKSITQEIDLFKFVQEESFSGYWIPLLIALVCNVIFYFFFYYRYKKDRQVKEQKIIAGTASAQFDALKNQLDPHFLFNSLNVLTSLIEENPQQAQKFTTSLSKVYRYVLEQKNKELISLEEELAFAKTYMTLLKMRYEDSIVFTMPQHVINPEAKVVPLALQLLLENAVKHNVVSDRYQLHITIEEAGNYLIVRNNLQPKKIMEKSSGVGLINIKQRYALLTSRIVQINTTETEFIIKIPTLTHQLKQPVMNTEYYLSEKKYAMAKEHVEKLKGFYINFGLYCLIIPILIGLNLYSGSFPWAIFPALGWGLGVFFHAADVFNWNFLLGKNWEDRKIKQLMDQQKRK